MIYRTKWVVFLLVTLAASASGQVVLETTDDLGRIDIVEHLGDTIPTDLVFTDDRGEEVRLADLIIEGEPVLFVLGYYECPMLCNLVFNGVADALKSMSLMPGEDFRIITLSIDPLETADLAHAKKANYLSELDKDIDPAAWTFLVGEQENVDRVSEAVGFKYFYDADRDEYAHAAAIYVLTDRGVISRYLYGVEYNPSDLKLALMEAADGQIGSTVDRLILYCFHYDPDSKGYVVVAGNVMKIGGLVTVIVLGIFLTIMWIADRRRKGAKAVVTDKRKVEV